MIKTEDYMREFVFIFWERLRTIIWTTVIVFAASVAIALYWPPTYGVQGSVLVKGSRSMRSPETLEKVELKTRVVDREDLNSEAEILTSTEVVRTAVEALRKRGEAFHSDKYTAEKLESTIESLRGSIETAIMPDSNVIEINLYGKDRHLVKAVLKEVLTQYARRRRDVFSPKGMQEFFEDQVKEYDKALAREEERQLALARKTRSVDSEQEIANNLIFKKDLQQQLRLARTEFSDKSESVRHITSVLESDGVHFFSFIDNLSITNLSENLQLLIVARGDALRLYHPESKQVQRYNEQIENLSKVLRTEIRAYTGNLKSRLQGLEKLITELETEIKTIEKRNLELYEGHVAYKRLQREMALRSHSFETFSRRLEESRARSGSNATSLFSISILNWPRLPQGPAFPKPHQVIPIGLLAGFIAGFCLAFLREFLDHTFKWPEDAERYAELPALFSIPLDPER